MVILLLLKRGVSLKKKRNKMAQKIDALKFRLGINSLWSSQWYSNKNYSSIFFEDCLIRTYLQTLFNLRGFLSKRCLIQRKSKKVFIFFEFYASSYIPYQVPRKFRKKKKFFYKIIFLKNIIKFCKKLLKQEFYISFKNIFIVNRINRLYVRRLRGLFSKYKKYKFTLNILNIFNIAIRSRCAFFLAKILSTELEIVNFKKRDTKIWRFISFTRKLVEYIKGQNTALHGIRIHIKGRFKGIKRSRSNRYVEGTVPFNTIRANIDYCVERSITVNGSFGLHVWLAYKKAF